MNEPDAVVRKLWRLRERLSSPLSAVPYESSGKLWGTTCTRCEFAYHRKSAAGFEACAKCGAPWPEVEGRVSKGSAKHRPRVNPLERSYFDFARCISILAHIPEPAHTLYVEHLSPFGGGMVYALRVARDRGVCGSLSAHAYWSHIRTAREIVGLRLSFMGGVVTRGVA